MRTAISVVASVVLVALAPDPAVGQDPYDPDTAAIVLSALGHIDESLPRGRVVIDPRIVCTASLAGWRCPDGFVDGVAALEMTLGSRDFTHLCMTSAADCRLVGTDVLIDLSELRVFRRTATVIVHVWWQPGDADQPLGRRRTQLHLQRNDDWSWRVTGEEEKVLEGGMRDEGSGPFLTANPT